jgi:hypothetical protein
MLCGGGPRLLLLRESLITGVLGLVLLISLLFPRPLMYYMAESTASKHSPEEVGRFELLWEKPRFVHCMYLMTTVWGVGLVCEGRSWPGLFRPSGSCSFHRSSVTAFISV